MAALQVLLSGIAFGESPRWGRDGRLWFADWGAQELVAVDLAGERETIARIPSFPFCIDWLPDGRLLIVSARQGVLLRREHDGTLVTHSDLRALPDLPGNEIVVDRRGNAYLNGGGFDFAAGAEFAPGIIALVTPDGQSRQVADGIAFPNGMALTPDGATLIIAESYGNRLTAFDIAAEGDLTNRRVWAALGDGVPDGICLDAEGAIWYADVPNKRCVRVREGGEVTQTVELDRGGFSCALGGPDGRTLFIVGQEWNGMANVDLTAHTGQVLTVEVAVPGVAWR